MFHLLNAHDCLQVHYPLFQLKGEILPFCGCSNIIVYVKHKNSITSKLRWMLCESRYKVFVPLSVGCNTVELVCMHFSVDFRLFYEPIKGVNLFVRPIYVLCSDETGEFQCPEGKVCDKYEACRRIGFAMRLLQTLTAEAFYLEHRIRKTFMCDDRPVVNISPQVLLDNSPSHSRCWFYRSNLSKQYVIEHSAEEVWRTLAYELHTSYPNIFEDSKWVAFMACTRYHPPTKYISSIPLDVQSLSYEKMLKNVEGFFALGTGGLALLGTGTLHAWPGKLDELQSSLINTRRVYETGMMDDTAYRHTFWAAFSTGLGSVWHELGHCFGLDHYPYGIMCRGGDDVHLCLGFPPPNSVCPHNCVIQNNFKTTNEFFSDVRDFKPPTPKPTSLQFQHIRFLSLIDQNSKTNKTNKSEKWNGCNSVWHQGTAFWGSDAIVKLAKNPWFVIGSTDVGSFRCT